MKNLSHKSSINIPHWALGLLLHLFFCAPAYASDAPATPTFRSTSPFGINQTIQGATMNNSGIHQGTIYKPFSDEHPTAGLNPSYNLGNGNNDDDDDIGIPGWADTPSEPLPIGDTLPLFLFAAAMIAIIWIKQRKQKQLTTQSQSTNNNDTTQHMTTRKQTYQSLRQKLFLLLVFVCIAGQVSAQNIPSKIYFRPSTTKFTHGYTNRTTVGSGKTEANGFSDVYWTKGVSNFFPIELRGNGKSSKFTTFEDLDWATDINTGSISRFIPITVSNGYTHVIAYRAVYSGTWSSDNYSKWVASGGKHKGENSNSTIENQNTVPQFNNSYKQPSEPEPIPTDGKNLLCNKEGWWDVWYWAYYLPKTNDVKIYFAKVDNWEGRTDVKLLTGKDIYTYETPATTQTISNTKLAYFSLNGSEFGYLDYGFIGGTNTWDDKKTIPSVGGSESNWVYDESSSFANNKTDAAKNSNANQNRIANRRTYSAYYTKTLSNLLSGYNLFIPGKANKNASLTKKNINSWESLNHTQTIKVVGGGKINYYTHKLKSASESKTETDENQTGTVTFTAAYTATVALRAIPDNGCAFIGFFEEGSSTPLAAVADQENAGQYTYSYSAPNGTPKTITAVFTDKNKVRSQTLIYNESEAKYEWKDSNVGGNISQIRYTNAEGNAVVLTNINNDPNDKDGFVHKNDVLRDEPLTLTAEAKVGYTFIGWWNNSKGPYTDNPWQMIPKNQDESITARFAPSRQQTISIHTYDKNQDKYVLSGDGGSVSISYSKIIIGSGYGDATATVTTQGTHTALYNTSITLSATPSTGYAFLGWYEGQNLVSKELTYTYTATEARNITAYFAEGTGTTTLQVRAMEWDGSKLVKSDEGGTFTLTHSGGVVYAYQEQASDFDKVLVSHSSPVTFQVTINNEYEFIAWFNVTADRRFFDNPWVMEDPSKVGYNDGTKETYVDRFTAVFAHKDDAKRQTIKIEGPGTVTANYTYYNTSTREVTFEQSSSFVAWYNKQVTLTAEALAGYEFVGWYDAEDNPIIDGVSGNKLTYTATTARTITAKFKSAVNKLTVSVLNYNTSYNEFREYEYEYNKVALTGGDKSLESYSSFSCEFEDATNVTLTATPEDGEDGYDFIGWYQNNTLLSKEARINVNVIGIQSITARFAPKKCRKLILRLSVGGLYSVKYAREDLFDQEGMYYIAHSQHDKDIEIFVPYDAKIEVINPQPIHGYKYLGYKVFNGVKDANKDVYTIQDYDPTNPPTVLTNFVRTDEQVIYLDISNKDVAGTTWNGVTKFGCNRRTNFKEINKIEPGSVYFEEVGTSTSLLKVTIEANAFEYVTIHQKDNAENCSTGRLAIPSTRYNCYKLNAYQSSTGEWVDAWTTVDTEKGDYRLIYREQTVEDKNTIRVDYEFNEGDRIKKITSGTKTDIVNLHIYNKVSSDGINGINNPEVILQQWDGNNWVDVERYMVFGPLRSDKPGVIKMPNRKNTASETIVVDKGIAPIIAATNEEDQACGVWNFYIKQENGTAKLEVGKTEKYTGNYYIRTTNADGQYHRYTIPANVMQYSEYAKKNSDYSHYFIRYVDINEDGTPTSEAGKHNQVKFTVATDYAIFLCKELMINNNRFSEDEYENDIFVINDNNNPKLPADATVRFGWDSKTNRLTRAYIANTTIKNNEYLVVEGTNIGSPSGDAVYFTDNSNWLYTIDLNATKNADTEVKAKVKAKMNGQYQYFMGAQPGSQNEYETLISGNGTNTYPIRLLYDFKDDRFTTIYRPDGQLEGTINVNTPLMIERVHNYEPTQIKLTTNEHTVTPTGSGEDQYTQPAYAVMTFLEEKLASKDITHHEKMFYWISFPFNVCIRDVFGLGDYGKYWIMEEYDGAQRAAQGLAQSNWKYITKKSTVLEKNKGYVLCLNYSQILQDQLFKSYGSSDQELNSGKLSLYFPSNGIVDPKSIVGGQDATIDLAEHYNANTAWNHHNWHIIGVPSFANPGTIDEQQDAPFVYEYWHPGDAYAAVSIKEVEFQSMHAYMVQYAGKITWTNKIVNTGGNVDPKFLAAKTDEEADKKIMLHLELQQAGSTIDKTYVQLRNDKGTKGFDMSLDLTKIINAGANIYSIVDNHEMAGNAIPKDETVLPLGVVITAAGDYTFAMPQGTEGMIVELIDYEQGTSTNLLMSDYTITLNKGTFNQRFALRLKPDKVATSVDNIGNGANGDEVRKLLIDGVLYLQKGNNTYDAQGKHVQ